MSIRKVPFGTLESGEAADLYILTNASGASVEITNFGGIIRAINVPDREGKLGNVVLGYKDVSGYQPLCGYLGALIGRVGNRIADGKCVLDGKELTLAKNEGGVTHLHGGNVGFDRKFWDATPIEGICEDSLILKYTSPDGEEGYPGTLKVMVTYTSVSYTHLPARGLAAVCPLAAPKRRRTQRVRPLLVGRARVIHGAKGAAVLSPTSHFPIK